MKKPVIGIIAAMQTEMELLRDKMQDLKKIEAAGTDLYLGTIGNYEVALMLCGIGKVSAALGAQFMILSAHPDYIINTGSAGALAKGLSIGDFVLARETVEWDMEAELLGHPRGYIYSLDRVFMEADQYLTQTIKSCIPEGAKVVEGLVASGDQFVCSDAQRNEILGAYPEALCAEMEGSAIGHVCVQNHVPFSVVRCMSDTADGDSNVDFAAFSREAGEKSAEVLLTLLDRDICVPGNPE